MTESAAEGLLRLHTAYSHQIRFVMVQVREAHPGRSIGQPKTLAQKLRHGIALKRHHNLPFEVAVDDIDGTLHRMLGTRPNSAYVIAPSGTILFRAQWANETQAMGDALAAIVAGRVPLAPTVTRTWHALAQALGYAAPVLDAAGKGARFDTWKVAPPMGVMMTLSGMFFFLPREKRGLPAMALTMAATVSALAAAASVLH